MASLFSAVALIVDAAAVLVDDGAVTFSLPGIQFTNSAGDIVTAGLASDYSSGATSIRIEDPAGSTLGGDVPKGSLLTIDGTDYTILDVDKSGKTIGLVIDPGLVGAVLQGEPVANGPAEVSLSPTTTVSTKAAVGRDFEDQVGFAFQYTRSDYSILPRQGWRCERVSTSGSTYTGSVIHVDTGEIMVVVWCGGGK